FGKRDILACFDRLLEMSEAKLKAAIAEWDDGRFEAERFVDDDGVDLEQPVRIHVVIKKRADELHFDFSGSADETKGPANIPAPPPIPARPWCRRPAPTRSSRWSIRICTCRAASFAASP